MLRSWQGSHSPIRCGKLATDVFGARIVLSYFLQIRRKDSGGWNDILTAVRIGLGLCTSMLAQFFVAYSRLFLKKVKCTASLFWNPRMSGRPGQKKSGTRTSLRFHRRSCSFFSCSAWAVAVTNITKQITVRSRSGSMRRWQFPRCSGPSGDKGS
jgi:hypothetical protein